MPRVRPRTSWEPDADLFQTPACICLSNSVSRRVRAMMSAIATSTTDRVFEKGALKTATLGGQTTTYGYGPSGSRAVKTGPDGIPHVFVRGPGGPIAEYAVYGVSAIPVREYAYLKSQLLASFTPAPISPPNLTVTLITPTNGQTMASGQQITLTATATAGSGLTIARVEYYVRGVYIGQSTSASTQYPVPWTNTPLPGGAYLFTARVVSTDGHAVASTPVTVTVQ